MGVAYDADVDILSAVLDAKHAKGSKEILPRVVVDFDRENQVIAFENCDAKKLAGLSLINIAMSPLLVETRK